MLPAVALAYPLLLAAVYGLYRVGRAKGRPRTGLFEHVRLVTLAGSLGLVAALQVRFAATGRLETPLALLAGVLSIAAVFGLLGIHALEVSEAWRRRAAPSGLA